MNYDRIVALAREHEAQGGVLDVAAEVRAAAQRLDGEWYRHGWDGTAVEPLLLFEAATELEATVTAPLYGALVARYLNEYGHGNVEALVGANRVFILEARAQGASPREAADVAHAHLAEVRPAPRQVPARLRRVPPALRTTRARFGSAPVGSDARPF